ncbi:homoserine dehydrogenase [uncultured Fretibacterium sp.]|uniref:homoserine dehydrogenase n=1 Tax=uncultured Fretibacterium sp. TaxID=1678694 RepID=UPI00325FB5FA
MASEKIWKLALAGFGSVGRGLVELLHENRGRLEERCGFRAQVCLIVSRSHGTALMPDGLSLGEILQTFAETGRLGTACKAEDSRASFEELLARSGAEVLIEATPTNLDGGEPGLSHVRCALERGLHVVTSNKAPIALAYDELNRLARERGVRLLFEGTVQGGTPLLAMAREGLAGCAIEGVQGILNASTNYVLTEMEKGRTYEEACAEARSAGVLEADPTLDVEGWDAAVKLVILAHALFDANMRVEDVDREGITRVTPEMIRDAKERGERIKLLAELKREGSALRASVRPTSLPLSNPIAALEGTENIVTLYVDPLGPVTLRGSGGGGRETAQGILADLLSIARYAQDGERHSTGNK